MAETEFDLRGSRILVIDDEPGNLDLLCSALEDIGYEVQIAVSGEKGLELATQSHPDLILLDVMMPGIDGYETCRRLKKEEKTRDIPVIFLTSLDESSAVVEGFRVGGVDYVHKPFQKEEVLVRVQTHLERGWLIQTLEHESRELAELNAQLEEKVDERTVELQVKVTELESKDRISQRLLTVHTLSETLDLVLEGITQIMAFNRAVIYLMVGEDFKPASAFGVLGSTEIVGEEKLDQVKPSTVCIQAMKVVREEMKNVQIRIEGEQEGLFVPILRDDDLLGIIEVVSSDSIEADALYSLEGFALQAAVAISDAQMSSDGGLWKQQLEDALKHNAR